MGLLLAASLALMAPSAGASECTAAALDAHVDTAVAAFGARDPEGFAASRTEAEEALVCAEAPLTPADAAAFHRMQALGAFLARRSELVLEGFRASAQLDPDATLPPDLVPPGHALHSLFDQARAMPPSGRSALFVPEGAAMIVDGTPGSTRPSDRATVLQLREDGGPLVWSGYVLADATLPDWSTLVAPPVAEPLPSDPERRVSVPLLAGSGAAAVAATGLLAVALGQRARFDDPQTPYADLDGHSRRANGAFLGAQVAGGMAVGLGALTVATAVW